MTRAGALSTYIEVEAATLAQSSTGEPIKTWTRFCKAWAKVTSVDVSERFQSEREVGYKLRVFTIRYNAGILFEHRILFKDEYYNIRSIKQLEKFGRDKFMEILGEVIDGA